MKANQLIIADGRIHEPGEIEREQERFQKNNPDKLLIPVMILPGEAHFIIAKRKESGQAANKKEVEELARTITKNLNQTGETTQELGAKADAVIRLSQEVAKVRTRDELLYWIKEITKGGKRK